MQSTSCGTGRAPELRYSTRAIRRARNGSSAYVQGLGAKAPAMIVREAAFEYSDPAALDAQIVALKNSGADVFMNLAVGRLATRAIRKAYDIDWHPLQFIPNASLSIAAFLEPAGLKKAAGIITNARSKAWLKPQSSKIRRCVRFLDG